MPKEKRLDKVLLLLIGLCLLVLVVACSFGWSVYQENKGIEVQNLQNHGDNIASKFDQYLNMQEVTLKIVSSEAQSILNDDKIPLRGTVLDLVPVPDRGGYTLNLPKDKTEEQMGNLTGLGEIPFIGSAPASEIGMALGLSPIFEQVIQNNSALPWIYYTSQNRFLYIYPRVSPDEFFFSDDLLNASFFTVANPSENPSRNLVWTPLYEDLAGAGWMVTLSQPVYEQEQFLGVLSIDVGISDLQWILESELLTNAEAYLLDPHGKIMVGSGKAEFDVDLANVQFEKVVEQFGHTLMIFPLSKVDWFIVLDIDKNQLAKDVMEDSSQVAFIILLVAFALFLTVITTLYMRSFKYLSVHDHLTGVLNRRGFEEFAHTLAKKKSEKIQFGLAVVDIDWFKKYNDHYGHIEGDNVLRRVANALRNCMRSSADQVFRLGGEEFGVVIYIKSPEEMPQILDRLVGSVYDLGIPHVDSQFERVTISIGGTSFTGGTLSHLADVYKRADFALYTAKQSGRNRWILSEWEDNT